jgi:hypothetical protein
MYTDYWGIGILGDERIDSELENLLDVLAAGLTDQDVLCKIISFLDTKTLLEMTLLEHGTWSYPIEAALALPSVFGNHFPCISVDANSLEGAHDIGPERDPCVYRPNASKLFWPAKFTFTGHFQSLLRLCSENDMPSRSCIVDKWPNGSNDRAPQRHERGMYIHVCRGCKHAFRCVEAVEANPAWVRNGKCGGCRCMRQYGDRSRIRRSGETFCGNKCYWDYVRPGGILEEIDQERQLARRALPPAKRPRPARRMGIS